MDVTVGGLEVLDDAAFPASPTQYEFCGQNPNTLFLCSHHL